jgi:hypothetical protein
VTSGKAGTNHHLSGAQRPGFKQLGSIANSFPARDRKDAGRFLFYGSVYNPKLTVVNARVTHTLQNRPLQTELRTQPRFKERKTVSDANSPSKKNKDNLNYC